MIEIIPTLSFTKTTIEVPGSKSLTNRALILASLSEGETVLHNVLYSDDTKYMMESLDKIGVKIHRFGHTLAIDGKIEKFTTPSTPFCIGNAGTAMRFLTALATLVPGEIIITGNERMRKRPIKDLVDSLKQLGAEIDYLENEGFPPLRVKKTDLRGRTISIRGDLSSQYLSALLMITPCLDQATTIEMEGKLSSKPYVDMTMKIMRVFGAEVENYAFRSFIVKPSGYRAQTYTIEGDASSAGYYWALEFLHDTPITVTNVSNNSIQGDATFKSLLEQMKGVVPDEIDMSDIPDCMPTLAVILATIPKKTRIKNILHLRIKETDRLAAMVTELRKIGVEITEGDDFIEIIGKKDLHGAEIETYNDHRIAMSFAILGTKVPGIKIKNPDCVNKSYPTFWKDLKSIGVDIRDV